MFVDDARRPRRRDRRSRCSRPAGRRLGPRGRSPGRRSPSIPATTAATRRTRPRSTGSSTPGTLRKACDTAGTETADGYTESAYNLDVALRLARILRAAGARVVLTRTTDTGWGPCITERAAIGNRAHADAAISIHADGGPAAGRGFHVIYPPPIPRLTDDIAAASRRLALAVRAAFRAGTGEPYATTSAATASTSAPTSAGSTSPTCRRCSSRPGTCATRSTRARLESAAYRQREAVALARGIEAFLR